MKVEDGADPSPVWLADAQAYHVHFWDLLEEPSHWQSSTHRISEARDIAEVFDWARSNAAGRRFVVYVEVPPIPPGPLGLLLVYGQDPTSP